MQVKTIRQPTQTFLEKGHILFDKDNQDSQGWSLNFSRGTEEFDLISNGEFKEKLFKVLEQKKITKGGLKGKLFEYISKIGTTKVQTKITSKQNKDHEVEITHDNMKAVAVVRVALSVACIACVIAGLTVLTGGFALFALLPFVILTLEMSVIGAISLFAPFHTYTEIKIKDENQCVIKKYIILDLKQKTHNDLFATGVLTRGPDDSAWKFPSYSQPERCQKQSAIEKTKNKRAILDEEFS